MKEDTLDTGPTGPGTGDVPEYHDKVDHGAGAEKRPNALKQWVRDNRDSTLVLGGMAVLVAGMVLFGALGHHPAKLANQHKKPAVAAAKHPAATAKKATRRHYHHHVAAAAKPTGLVGTRPFTMKGTMKCLDPGCKQFQVIAAKITVE